MESSFIPYTSEPNRRIVLIDLIRSGQPRPYADHERVSKVEIRYFDHLGNLVADPPSANMLKQHALSAVGGDRHVQIGKRKNDTMDDHFKTYVESVEVIGPFAVLVTIKEPYTD